MYDEKLTALSRTWQTWLETGRRVGELPRFFRYLVAQLDEDRCRESAAALTYLTLFALVPLLTVGLSIVSAVPAFNIVEQQAQALIFTHFLPGSGEEIFEYLVGFAEQARKLSVAGLLILVASAFMMLKNIEKTFNRIWRVREDRKGLSNFLIYWAVLSLGPVLLGVAIAISTYMMSLSIFSEVDPIGLRSTFLSALPLLLSAAALTLIFTVVPNCRVPMRHAVLGGLSTALTFAGLKSLFAWAISLSSYQAIYGTFAAIPLFLIWIYLSWLVILGGAEFVRALTSYDHEHRDQFSALVLIVAVLERFYQSHASGGSIRESDLLRSHWLPGKQLLGISQWDQIRNLLLDNQVIRSTEQREYVLTRSLQSLSLADLYRIVRSPELGYSEPVLTQDSSPWYQRIQALTSAAEKDLLAALDYPVAAFFENKENQPDATQ